ncbi:MAG: hypothetical protein E6Q74_05260 [Pseudoxanthomonas sp.]|nr:MAG: hypothetical protein E6Q74_05260 [Pseudoxanthomonas sp.]
MTIQFINHTMSGAPTLNGQVGTLASLLKTCLVDGFGLVTLDSLVVSGGIATATRAAGHSAVTGSKQTIAGATPSGLNGVKGVLSHTPTTFTFDATGISDQTATGTITTKVSPLGWTREFNATNIEVFRSPNVAGSRHYLQVDDTGTTDARVRAYETMTGINTGTNEFPTDVQISGGGYWPKSQQADATAVHWALVGDDRTFYLMHRLAFNVYASLGYANFMAFGDFESLVPGDGYSSFLVCAPQAFFSQGPVQIGYADINTVLANGNTTDATQNLFLSRAYTGLGVSTRAQRRMLFPNVAGAVSGWSSGQLTGLQYPNGADSSLMVTKVAITEPSARTLRGYFRGQYVTPQAIGPSVFATGESVSAVAGLSGRTLRAFNSYDGCWFVDCTGPW